MSKKQLSVLIAAALFSASSVALSEPTAGTNAPATTASSAVSMHERAVDVDGDGVNDAVIRIREDVEVQAAVDAAAHVDDLQVDSGGLTMNERSVDVDGDGITDAVIRVREDVAMQAALDAIAVSDTELHTATVRTETHVESDGQVLAEAVDDAMDSGTIAKSEPGDLTMSETPQERIADADIATPQAAAMASTDRASERTGGELRTRTLPIAAAEAAASSDTSVAIEDERSVTVVEHDDALVASELRADESLVEERRVDLDERAEWEERKLDENRYAAADTNPEQTPVEVLEGEPQDAFVQTAGTEGFSSGHTAAQAQDRFAGLDSDGDGSLDRDELGGESQLAGSFQSYDINDDGEISQNEFQSWFAASGQQREAPDTRVADTEAEPEDDEAMFAEDSPELEAQPVIVQDDEDPVEYEDF